MFIQMNYKPYLSKSAACVVAVSITLSMTSCKNQSGDKNAKAIIDIADMDTTIKPGDDFYRYAAGAWLKKTTIPNDKSMVGAFDELQEENYTQLQTIMEEASKASSEAKKNSVKQQIGDFYKSGMDTNRIEKDGYNPIKGELEKINTLQNTQDLAKYIGYLHTNQIYPLFYIYSGQDEKNSTRIIAQFYQGGIGLPDRDYYFMSDENTKSIRAEYVKHIQKMFQLIGQDEATSAKNAQTVMDIETKLAKPSSTRLELRDPQKNYNMSDLAKLQTAYKDFDWKLYFETIGLANPGDINLGQEKFIAEMSKMIKSISMDQWKVYLTWNVINSSASYLSNAFVQEHFNFYGKTLSGTTEMRPRYKRVLGEVSGSLGEAVGQLYVEKYFPPKAKERMIKLVANLKDALKERISKLTWMGDATKKEAIAKLERINVKVGYPDKWIDYSSVEIVADNYFQNALNAQKFAFRRDMNKIGKPVDRAEWGMTPQTVNAYYSPNMNEIVFPAAILQPPFFYMDGDDAVNYGAIGVVIGHEMTHGFDDQGRQYDKEGNLRDWWTKEDAENFKKQTQVLVDQFNAFIIADSLKVDGNLTLGENIADLGGITVSYVALQKALQGKKADEKIEGFTQDQRYFLSYAKVWRNNIRIQELMRRLKEDVHSPGEARVNGTVYNVPEFYKAFNIKEGTKHFIPVEKRAVIW